jgi:GMP synthase (glutamine-hydrolysing)
MPAGAIPMTHAMPAPAPNPHAFLILETGQPVASMRRHGRFPHWIRVAAGMARDEAVVVDVERGGALPAREGFAGVLVTGSAAMVTERRDWSERTAQWLHDAAHAGMPMLGICYGHQLIAHALGGEVGDNPAGREIGTVEIALEPPAGDDPLFGGLPATFAAQATHLQSVLRAPAGATVLARSVGDACHAFRWGGHAWGVQFHPEFSTTHMRGYVHAREEALAREGRCSRSLARQVGAAPHARTVLRRFVRHARDARHH